MTKLTTGPAADLAGHFERFVLDREWTFLNHGSFGACPAEVLRHQDGLRARLERQPVQFFARDLQPLLDDALRELAALCGAQAEDLCFVPNATAGVNAVLRSLRLEPGDELLTTDHVYNACKNALEFVAAQHGAAVVIAPVPFPLADPAQITAAVLARVTPRTRLALLDHVTSPTALVFPVAELVAALHARGVDTLVDGAHALGMLPLELDRLGAAYYTANCHKWLCAPKGAAILHVRRDRQAQIRPPCISHGANAPLSPGRSRYRLEFDWTGTTDPSSALCAPVAARLLGGLLPGGLPALQARNHDLAVTAQALLCEALAVAPPCPPSLLGSMATVPLPDRDGAGADALQAALVAARIEVPLIRWPDSPRLQVRVSAQIYNTLDDYQRLADFLRHYFQP